jgi:hypothetical protein
VKVGRGPGGRIARLILWAAVLAACEAPGSLPSEPPPATGLPAATPPTIGSGSSPTEIKYALIAALGEPFFCDPDYYPVARADESELAQAWFETADAAGEEVQGIRAHLGLGAAASLTPEQVLAVYREHKRLGAIGLGRMGESYRFEMRVGGEGAGNLLTGTVDPSGRIEISTQEASFNTCPICGARCR